MSIPFHYMEDFALQRRLGNDFPSQGFASLAGDLALLRQGIFLRCAACHKEELRAAEAQADAMEPGGAAVPDTAAVPGPKTVSVEAGERARLGCVGSLVRLPPAPCAGQSQQSINDSGLQILSGGPASDTAVAGLSARIGELGTCIRSQLWCFKIAPFLCDTSRSNMLPPKALLWTARAHAENSRLEKELQSLRSLATRLAEAGSSFHDVALASARQRGEVQWLHDLRKQFRQEAKGSKPARVVHDRKVEELEREHQQLVEMQEEDL